MRIGDKIKVLLDRRGMTQRELAKRIGITEVSMSRYVCNARIPKGPLIAAMAKALGVSADELLGLAEGPVISDDKPPSAQPMQIGWICPVCGRGLSPLTMVCPCQNGKGWKITCKT